MKKTSATIIFFGSGPVAARSLELLAQDFEIEAVVTKPRPVHHRGDYPVLDIAAKLGLPVHTVASKTELSRFFVTKPFNSRLGVLIDFGIILPNNAIDYFELGVINSHFSILPEWRGADPISFAILSGQSSTGVSLMRIVEAMDEGPLLAYGEYELPADIDTPLLTEHLINFSHKMLADMLPKYLEGSITPAPQTVTGRTVSYSRKLTKEDSILDFMKPAEQLESEIRAFAVWPRSRTSLGEVDVIITRAHVKKGAGTAGNLWRQDKQFGIYTKENILVVDQLIPAGKKEMSAAAFLSGYKLD
jgi:methionyl-tRNA formyltransferase